ncbi:hypothetical protein ANCDUO_17635 [Ancylostoma duodenale]|uniref:Uncharacterized protein n=1 Tax=Ancylostoma duodenale TaxID=51022 RepID=A0A0C2FUG9_9BILA|nr:hypothetical protein ANCDUO_17635 [Ancylostoma duodenale]
MVKQMIQALYSYYSILQDVSCSVGGTYNCGYGYGGLMGIGMYSALGYGGLGYGGLGCGIGYGGVGYGGIGSVGIMG